MYRPLEGSTVKVNRTKNNTIPDEIKDLIEKNKNKPRPSLKDYYKDNPDKYKEMCSKLKEAHSKVSPLSYKIRSWNEILKRKFEPLKITNYKIDKNNAKQFYVSSTHFTFSSSGNNKYFRISKYNTFYECYLDAKNYKILYFYSRKWYIKTFIKRANLELVNEKFTPIETNKPNKN